MTYDKDHANEVFRTEILNAFDRAAARVFGKTRGIDDADLPALFKIIDAHVETLSARSNHPLYENWVGSDKYMKDRAFLQSIGKPVFEDDALTT